MAARRIAQAITIRMVLIILIDKGCFLFLPFIAFFVVAMGQQW
ncbi:hypothetical protein [Asinibacterium sp. OR53]|jgi:hypothetical protein|nr:hypothetical protein [Asinibacterium sp. OR53]